jgi:hypothetical protein
MDNGAGAHVEETCKKENIGEKHRANFKAERGRYPAKSIHYRAITRLASLSFSKGCREARIYLSLAMCGAFFCKSQVTTLVALSQLPQLNHRLSMSAGRLLCIASCDLRRLISITLFFSITLFCLKVAGDRLFFPLCRPEARRRRFYAPLGL